MTPPEIMCPAPPPPPPLQLNGHTDTPGRTDLLAAIRNGTNLKKTPKENSSKPPQEVTSNGIPQINGNSAEVPAEINGMNRVQKELHEHFRAKENGTLPRKTPAMQPIVKRLLTEKPTESARKDDTERLMLNHGKRNFVVKSRVVTNGKIPSDEVAQEPQEQSTETPVNEVKEASPEREEKMSVKPEKPEKKLPLTPLKISVPKEAPVQSPDIKKIIKTPTTPKSPQSKLKITHGKPNYTLPGRIRNTQKNPERPTAEFLAVKLREVPNSPLQEAAQVPTESPCVDTVNLPPFRSATMARKRENPLPNPMIPAAPTYEAPKYNQKLVVSFAMDLAATPNRYPDHVKVSSSTRASPEIPEDLVELRQKKFTIDPNRLSVRQQ